MNYLGKFFRNVHDFYKEINSATLTGAIDVIVVEQPDGTFLSSPFHVRFGKMGVLRAREKIVDIEINGDQVEIHMKLGDSGEAFFVEEVVEEEDDVPEHLATSPIPDDESHACDDIAREMEELATRAGVGSSAGLPVDFHPYSDGEMSPTECGSPPESSRHLGQRPVTPLSDSEYEITKEKGPNKQKDDDDRDQESSVKWDWGQMPRVPASHSRKPSANAMALNSIINSNNSTNVTITDPNSQLQTPLCVDSLPVDGPINFLETATDVINKPDIIVPQPITPAAQRDQETANQVKDMEESIGDMINMAIEGTSQLEDRDSQAAGSTSTAVRSDSNVTDTEDRKDRDSNYCSGGEDPNSPISSPNGLTSPHRSPNSPISPVSPRSDDDTGSGVTISGSSGKQRRRRKRNHYRKVLRLTSDQIAALNLCYGPNDAVFSVTTAYQGTTKCHCQIYFWNYDDKIVISDIDGTITKSDVLGHILPILGRDWAQSGVTNLFTNIHDNGYKFIYLSARAIGQATTTRGYLRSIKQGDVCLPDGPLLLSPTSLIYAFHREVIEKRPEEFKISCLRDIQALFPTNPFYAGFGNKINDTWAYRAVGIHLSRIFTVNHKGELKLELIQTFQSSYTRLSDVVDQMFPPLEYAAQEADFLSEYSSFNYWRDPLPVITDEDDLLKSLLEAK